MSVLTQFLMGGMKGQIWTATPGSPFIVPDGVYLLWLSMVGGGGGGGGSAITSLYGAGGGGAGGAGYLRIPVAVVPGQSWPVVVGAAGVGVNDAHGTAGGDSSFGAIVAPGGDYGRKGGNANNGQGGYTTTLPAISAVSPFAFNGGAGGNGSFTNNATAGTSVYLFPGGTTVGGTYDGGGGGSSCMGPGGNGAAGNNTTSANGSAPTSGYGGGGGGAGHGTDSARTGGNGMPGLVIVEWFPPQ